MKEEIVNFLRSCPHPESNFWISKGINRPQPSVRRATRELAEAGRLVVDERGWGAFNENRYRVA